MSLESRLIDEHAQGVSGEDFGARALSDRRSGAFRADLLGFGVRESDIQTCESLYKTEDKEESQSVKWSEVGTQVCSLARSLSVVGDPWTLLFLREAFAGATKFEDFLSGTGSSRAIATARLGGLVEEGVLERIEYLEAPRRYEYRLTEMGRDLLPVILSLVKWGDEWLTDGGPRPVELTHTACGESAGYELRCKSCGEAIGTDVSAAYRPGTWATGRKTTKKRLRPLQGDAS